MFVWKRNSLNVSKISHSLEWPHCFLADIIFYDGKDGANSEQWIRQIREKCSQHRKAQETLSKKSTHVFGKTTRDAKRKQF